MHNVDSDKLSQTNSANRGHSEGLRHSVPSPACGQGNRIWVNKYESLTERTESKSSEIPVLFTHMRLPCACGGGTGKGACTKIRTSLPPPPQAGEGADRVGRTAVHEPDTRGSCAERARAGLRGEEIASGRRGAVHRKLVFDEFGHH